MKINSTNGIKNLDSIIYDSKWKKFSKDTRGNFAAIFAMASVPVLGITGMAVEYTRYSMVRDDLINSLDASGLAVSKQAKELGYEMGSLTNEQKKELRTYGRRFFNANFKQKYNINNLKVQFIFSQTTVTPKATGYMDTALLKLISVDQLKLDSTTEITLEGSGKLELALVLDVTGSMGSKSGDGTRMSVLKDSVYGMLDTLYGTDANAIEDNVKVGVVPFNSVVNTGGTTQMKKAWLDYDAESMWHGHNFIHIEDPYDIDMTQKVNLFALYDSNSDLNWKGCVEARPAPLDELDTIPGKDASVAEISKWNKKPQTPDSSVATIVTDAFSKAPTLAYSDSEAAKRENSKFVPFFYPDEPDCKKDNGKYPCEYGGTYGYLSENFKDGDSSSGYTNEYFIRDWRYGNYKEIPWSLYSKYYTIICQYRYNVDATGSKGPQWKNPCSADISSPQKDDDWDAIVDLTNAKYSYDHEYRLRQAYVGYYNPSTKKYEGKYDQKVSIYESGEKATRGPNKECSTAIQPLTTHKANVKSTIDALEPGGTTNTAIGTIWGWRVLSHDAPFTEGVDTSKDNTWRKAIVIMTDGQNYVSKHSDSHNKSGFESHGYVSEDRLNLGVDTEAYRREQARKTIRICQRMQAEGIKVFTVGFSISAGSESDDMLKACASTPTGENKTYYLAKNASELKSAFREITEDLVNLHISG
ncbi:MAG: pilus assembly protein TadG-related protein [bacterium]